jgi:hypothetical protein
VAKLQEGLGQGFSPRATEKCKIGRWLDADELHASNLTCTGS